jgi:hypothetical protein
MRGGIVAELADPNADARLRNYLHAELADFVATYVNIALASGDTKLVDHTRKLFQPRLDALLEGREVRSINRYDLLDWHNESPKLSRRHPLDKFSLGPDDVLRPADEPTGPRFVPPNRAKLREGLDRREREALERRMRR